MEARNIDKLEEVQMEIYEMMKDSIAVRKFVSLLYLEQSLKDAVKAEDSDDEQISLRGNNRLYTTRKTVYQRRVLIKLGYYKEYCDRMNVYDVNDDEYISISSWPEDLKEKIQEDPRMRRITMRIKNLATDDDYHTFLEEVKKVKREMRE